MGTIKILPESIANRIAAGEVIERPASIVKELVENALDAGAKSIEISIRHGGKSLIRVTDDGSGMSPEDAELAFKRYATSKISTAEDLARIASYGFRGEALPSIAAVSRVKLITRTENASSGIEMTIEGGKLTSAKEAPARKGTTIEVRDLFFNTPARRKFLKADSTEMGHVLEAVSNLALSRLDVRFFFKSSDKIVLDLLPGESAKARASAMFGEDTGKNFLEIDSVPSPQPSLPAGARGIAEENTQFFPMRGRGCEEEKTQFPLSLSGRGQGEGIRIWGLIGKPHLARANRSGQSFFVNRRWVRAFSLSHAVQAGYHGLLMHGQFPVSILFVEVDLERVDVNVHPTKQEVRISNETEIKTILKELISARLAQEPDLAPALRVPTAVSSGQMAADHFRTASSVPPDSTMLNTFSSGAIAEPPANYGAPTPELIFDTIALRDKLQITKILGQIHNTFIIAETDEGLMIVDQHAAHERVMFESLLKNFESQTPASQRLLMDEIAEFPAKHQEILKQMLPLLHKLGFEIDEFGENTFIIRALPAILHEENPVQLLKTFLEEREDGKIDTGLEAQQEEIAALIACKKKSVKAFDPMNPSQIKALLERLAGCRNPFSCPHGRPTFFKQSFYDLEKQFKRK